MKNLAILTLPLCLLTLLPTGCDADPESTSDLAATPTEAELGMWPLALPTSEVQYRSGGEKSAKAKHLIASDAQAAAWAEWVMALPYSTGPINDPTGETCASGQDGKYWFLAGTAGGSAERTCDVPADKHLVFPLLNWFCVFFPEIFPDEEAVAQAVADMVAGAASLPDGVCDLTLTVDGVDLLAGLDATSDLFEVTADPFEVETNEDHFASAEGFAGGPMPAITAGYYVHLKPLAPGDHVLEYGGSLCTDGKVDFETHTRYVLHVGP